MGCNAVVNDKDIASAEFVYMLVAENFLLILLIHLTTNKLRRVNESDGTTAYQHPTLISHCS